VARTYRLEFTSLKVVFSIPLYTALSVSITAGFWILFNVFDQLIFFYPIWIFYLPVDAINGFILTVIISILLGIVTSMNVYVLRHSKFQLSKPIFSGTALSLISSTCASCSSTGFLIISTFGGIGVFATNFLSAYQIPLRLISIGILLFALYTVHGRIAKSCVKDYHSPSQKRINNQ
jgi:hypothetical protein